MRDELSKSQNDTNQAIIDIKDTVHSLTQNLETYKKTTAQDNATLEQKNKAIYQEFGTEIDQISTKLKTLDDRTRIQDSANSDEIINIQKKFVEIVSSLQSLPNPFPKLK